MAFTPCHCVGNCLCLPTHPSIPCSYQVSVRQIHTAHYTQVLSYFQSSVVLKCLFMCVSHCYLIWAVVGKNSWIPNTFQFHEPWQQAVSSHIKLYKQLNTTPLCLTWELCVSNIDCLKYILTYLYTFHRSLRLSPDYRMWNMSKKHRKVSKTCKIGE